MSDEANHAYLLRPEAQPVDNWKRLTKHQKQGLRTLIPMIQQAIVRLDDSTSPDDPLPPWLRDRSWSQLAFIDGKRGTGKTTMMLTLVKLLHESGSGGQVKNLPKKLAIPKELRKRVIVLEPLDMEPLPDGTPILSAILARLNHVANQSGGLNQKGMLDKSIRGERDYTFFRQLQSKIARALDGNLDARKGNLDRDQFGQAVLEQEADRLQLSGLLGKALKELSKTLLSDKGESGSSIDSDKFHRHLFVVPIDDVDLNPQRCLQLLRLLRHYSPPQL